MSRVTSSGKISCSSTLLAAAGAEGMVELIDLAFRYGFDGLNLDCSRPDIFSLEGFSFRKGGEWVRHSVAKEVELHCISGYQMTGRWGEEAERLRRLICVAHALACPLVTVATPVYLSEAEWEPAYEAAIASLREASECARDLDICLAIEPREMTLARNMDDAVDLLDDVERENIGLVYNPGYLAAHAGEGPEAAVEMAKDFMLLMELGGTRWDAVERGEFDEAVQRARAAGFGEYVSLSVGRGMAVVHDEGEQVRRDLAHLRALRCEGGR
ncbi:MAG: sugar phosphate isomerase/epimerase [bacterium]|nr:sugar phosphate isomerase/epimerase [bacterium]